MYDITKNFAEICKGKDISFLGIDGWYKYLPRDCTDGSINFAKNNVGSVWLIVAGLADILLRVGAFVAVGYFIYGAFRMVTSQGSPEGVKGARTTMVNATVGLVITIVGAQVLGFVMRNVIGLSI